MKGKEAIDALLNGKVLSDDYVKIWMDTTHKYGPFLRQKDGKDHPENLSDMSYLWDQNWSVIKPQKYMSRWQVMKCVRDWEKAGYYVLVKNNLEGSWKLPTFHSYDSKIYHYYYTLVDEYGEPRGSEYQFIDEE